MVALPSRHWWKVQWSAQGPCHAPSECEGRAHKFKNKKDTRKSGKGQEDGNSENVRFNDALAALIEVHEE